MVSQAGVPSGRDDPEDGYSVVQNLLREPRTGRVVSTSFWVCGPAGFLRGPLGERDAQALAERLNRGEPPAP